MIGSTSVHADGIDELLRISANLENARRPEDVFGPLAGPPADQLRAGTRVYRKLALITHPDKNDENRKVAEVAFERLHSMWAQAQTMIRAGLYGSATAPAEPVIVKGRRHTYEIVDRLAIGEICNVYLASYDSHDKFGVFKVARQPRDNDLVRNEAAILDDLRSDLPVKQFAFFPEPIESVSYRQPGSRMTRAANVFEHREGFYSLREVRDHYVNGIHAQDMAWMYRRLLVALDIAHGSGFVHGAVTPDHILIHPEMHGLMLIDWSYAAKVNGKIEAVSKPYREWYPQEVFDKKPAHPGTDIAMAARSMIYLLGGDPLTGRLPDTVDARRREHHPTPRGLRAHFNACLLPAASRRPSAWDLYESFTELIEILYGKRVFRPFKMPSSR